MGARVGHLTYPQINEHLGDLLLDDEAVEALLSLLESRGIRVLEEKTLRAQTAPAQPAKAKPKRDGANRDDAELDDVLAQIESFFVTETPTNKRTSSTRTNTQSALDSDSADSDSADSENASDNESILGDEANLSGAAALILDDESDENGLVVQDAFSQYLQQMGRVPLLSADEETLLARQMREGNDDEKIAAREKLVEANLRLVVHIASRSKGRAVLPILDIMQEGNIGLITAIEKFDARKGQRLSSFASKYIRESIDRAVASQSRSIRLPGHINALTQKLQQTARELTQQLGREPSREEVAEAAKLTEKQVAELMRVASQPLSLDRAGGESEDGTELGERLSEEVEQETPLSSVSRSTLHETLETALESLGEREADVVRMRYGLGVHEGNEMSLEDVAKHFRITRDNARQLELRARRKMRRRLQGTALGDAFSDEEV